MLIISVYVDNIKSLWSIISYFHRRYDGVIMELHRGTQCSSCGLRFKEANNENYRQHLDWHFRMNRKEKETVAAHRSWFITTDVSIYIDIQKQGGSD